MLSAKTKGLILDIAIDSTQSAGDDAVALAVDVPAFIESWLKKGKKR